MTHYPLHHYRPNTHQVDKRYSVNLEYCGHETRRYVLRFCDEFVGAFRSLPDATLAAIGHRNIRMGNLPIIGIDA
jgi:hypothetical protein